MATQENSPVFVAQALDKVLEILKNSELYSPQFPTQQTKPDDQMASDLVSGLISVWILFTLNLNFILSPSRFSFISHLNLI